MRNSRASTSETAETGPAPGPEIDYSPKTYSLNQQILIALKLAAVIGGIFLLFWLVELF